MHFHLPKPLHGWREFLGEVGIIVIGVLIALGAEQVVRSVHAQHEVRDFQEAAAEEMGYNLSAYGDRMEQVPCVDQRLMQLEQWLALWKGGKRPVLVDPITRPTYLLPRTNVWQSRTADLGDKLSLQQRVAYARFYDLLTTFDLNVEKERDVWTQLQDYSHAERLGDAELMKLGGLIDRARQWQSFFRTNAVTFRKTAAQLNVSKGSTEGDTWDRSLCKPLRWRDS